MNPVQSISGPLVSRTVHFKHHLVSLSLSTEQSAWKCRGSQAARESKTLCGQRLGRHVELGWSGEVLDRPVSVLVAPDDL